MKPHVLIAVNDFTEDHMAKIAEALQGWATWTRIDPSDEARYREEIRRAQAVVGWPKAEWLLDSPVELLLLGSVGWDAYQGKGLERKPGFVLCNARGVMTAAVAEHLLAMMLALTRRLPRHFRDQSERRWERCKTYDEVTGAVACVVGLGDIGTDIARRLAALGMEVIGVRKNADRPHEYASEIYPLSRLKEAVAKADHVVLILPENEETRGMVNAGVFAAMKPGAYFYNLARGGIVDERALCDALQSGRLAGAGLDVFAKEPLPADSPLWDLENVIITPHAGGRSVKEFDRFCSLVAANLRNWRQGAPLINRVAL